jgi:hypothetical protein
MRRSTVVILIVCLLVGGVWIWSNESLRDVFQQYIENGEFLTLEARYTPEQIMETHRKELLADAQRTFRESELKFHPYLLMEVKYTSDKKSREGVIIWSHVDGEMVLNTESWEKTHGFEDTIIAGATRCDFKIINALAKNRGALTFEELQKELHLEKDIIQPWIESALSKHLIIHKGNEFQLHLQNPKILVQPQTKIAQWLVTKPYNYVQCITKKYSTYQLKNIAQAAFGEDFTIRNSHEIFLPVCSIGVLNPDGSIQTSYWNALNGQRISPKYMTQNQ